MVSAVAAAAIVRTLMPADDRLRRLALTSCCPEIAERAVGSIAAGIWRARPGVDADDMLTHEHRIAAFIVEMSGSRTDQSKESLQLSGPDQKILRHDTHALLLCPRLSPPGCEALP